MTWWEALGSLMNSVGVSDWVLWDSCVQRWEQFSPLPQSQNALHTREGCCFLTDSRFLCHNPLKHYMQYVWYTDIPYNQSWGFCIWCISSLYLIQWIESNTRRLWPGYKRTSGRRLQKLQPLLIVGVLKILKVLKSYPPVFNPLTIYSLYIVFYIQLIFLYT